MVTDLASAAVAAKAKPPPPLAKKPPPRPPTLIKAHPPPSGSVTGTTSAGDIVCKPNGFSNAFKNVTNFLAEQVVS